MGDLGETEPYKEHHLSVFETVLLMTINEDWATEKQQ